MTSTSAPLSVLLIEDSPGDARLIAEMFKEAPLPRPALTRTAKLSEAIERMAQDHFDAILLDLFLPDSSGIDTVTRVRRNAPNMPIVVLSGLNDQETAVEAVHQGAQDYLLKGSLDGALLLRSVRYAIERERTRREVDDLKSQIISLVSHELRTPIAHIKGFASSLLDTEVAWDEDTRQDFVREIDREADRLSALVSDILEMSRIESGETSLLEKDWQQPAELVREAVTAAEGVLDGRSVVRDVPEQLPRILVDAPQIHRVLVNLLENAAKYSPAGTEIRVSARADQGWCEFSVLDEGRGVPDEFRARIFEKFFRVRSPHEPRTPGTGLGLSICRGIVEAHGGQIWVEARAGVGSRFVFTVPLGGGENQPLE